jgi:hypothetical protein
MPIPCARCNTPLPKWELATNAAAMCTSCGGANTVRVFPALFETREAPAPEAALVGEAACFDHPGKRAVAACQQCGRFVCQLCAVEFGGAWCPTCIAAGSGQAQAAKLEPSRTLYDSIALMLPLVSLVVWPVTLLTAPAALVLTAVQWKAPLSLVRRNRWRFVAAVLVSLAELAFWVLLAVGVSIALKNGIPRS